MSVNSESIVKNDTKNGFWLALVDVTGSTRKCTRLLLVLLVLTSMTAEVSARYVFPRISRIRRRIEVERQAARKLKGDPQRPAILLVGNSLFERGVDIRLLSDQLSEYQVSRFVVSDTSYSDWYYGLRRLFAEGARPQVVVVGLSARQLLLDRIEGGLSANVLIQTSDLWRVGRELHKDNTTLSNLYFENLSSFYGGSTQFRKWLLATELMPDLQELGSHLRPPTKPLPPSSEIVQRATPRLRALSEVCRENGARLVFVVPPILVQEEEQFDALEQAGTQAGVDVLSPAEGIEFTADLFADGVHLNAVGEGKFTQLLAARLKQKLSDRVNAKIF